MSRLRVAVLAALLGGCGSLTETDNGVAILQILQPPSLTVAVGDSLQFTAHALDKSGNPVNALIQWLTPDTTIAVNPSTGLVTGLFAGTGRVQATTGTLSADAGKFSDYLVSALITVTVTPASASVARP